MYRRNQKSNVHALIPIDGKPRRLKEKKAYHARSEALDKETKRLRRFEDEELPAFTLWFEREFAESLVSIRHTYAANMALREQIEDVQRYADLRGISERAAYVVLAAARADGTYEVLWAELADALERADAEVEAQAAEDEGEDEDPGSHANDLFRDLFGDVFGKSEEFADAKEVQGSSEKTSDTYLKSMYRRLVRELHPDSQGSFCEARQKLWHEVQAAYAWADVQTIERLFKAVVHGEKLAFSLETAAIGDIIHLRKGVERRLRAIREQLREVKEHLAWDFKIASGNIGRLRRLKASIRGDLDNDRLLVLDEKRRLERCLAQWEKPQVRKTKHAVSPNKKRGTARAKSSR